MRGSTKSATAVEGGEPKGGGSFLTEEQRKQLDAALNEKAQEDAAKAKEVHNEQKTINMKARGASGVAREAKKGGGGGRFTWGTIFDSTLPHITAVDKSDPNYDSDEERNVVMKTQEKRIKSELDAYKEKVEAAVVEYFSSGDVKNVADSLEDLGALGYMYYFVKRLITTAMDRSNREREMASHVLSSLYADVIPPEQVQRGFTSLIDSIGDLVLDCPEAPELLANFIARAVVDDVLPPAMLQRVPDTPEPSKALKQKLENLLSVRHGAEKVLRCWGGGAGLAYQETKDAISRLLQEFAVSRDAEEAARCLRSLHVPFFYHEAVKQAVLMAMEASGSNLGLSQALVGLLKGLYERGEISQGQLSKGLKRVSDQLDDLSLDNPAAKSQHSKVMELAEQAGLLDAEESVLLRGKSVINHSVSHASIVSTSGGNSEPDQSSSVQPHTVGAFKAESLSIIREFFDSSDVGEVGRRLQEMDDPGLLQLFVKQAVVASFDRKNREKELVSQMLAQLTPSVLSPDQVAAGFRRLLSSADDLVLDYPGVVHLLSLFLGRAIVDEVLPPAFLPQVLRSLEPQSLGVAVVRTCGGLLTARHGAERLLQAWHGGAMTMDQIKDQFEELLKEYAAGARDSDEASRCLTELGAHHFHHQLVKSAIELTFSDPKTEGDMVKLLGALSMANVITDTQMAKGFSRVRTMLHEETLDYGPQARDAFARIVQTGSKQGWLKLDPES